MTHELLPSPTSEKPKDADIGPSPFAAIDAAKTRDAKSATPAEWNEAVNVLGVVADVLKTGELRGNAGTYRGAVEELYDAMSISYKNQLDPEQKLLKFRSSVLGIQPVIDTYIAEHGVDAWLKGYVLDPLAKAMQTRELAAAEHRVRGSVMTGPSAIVDHGTAGDTKQHASALRVTTTKVNETFKGFIEAVEGMAHHDLHAIDALLAARPADPLLVDAQKFFKKDLSNVKGVFLLLSTVDGMLQMTDDQLAHHMHEIGWSAHGVGALAEVVKAATSAIVGTAGLLAWLSSKALAKAAPAAASALGGLASTAVKRLDQVVAVCEVVHGAMTLLDAKATKAQKADGAVNLAKGVLTLTGQQTAAFSVALTWALVKAIGTLGANASEGASYGVLRPAFERLTLRGQELASEGELLTKAILLANRESDPRQEALLNEVADRHARTLSSILDRLIEDSAPQKFEADLAAKPGAHVILAKKFGPLAQYRGAYQSVADRDHVQKGAVDALDTIQWVLMNQSVIAVASATANPVAEVERRIKARDAKEEKH